MKTSKQQLQADYIKAALNPADFYRHELPNAPLKKHGWNDGSLCPFHADNKPGSFRVNVTTGAFKCFACGATGSDVISFTMTLQDLQFTEALTKLADEWGLV
ncbi:MAG: CHC2 zinc finger domain-containing protein [Methylococcales bacterium]|nr:CHC2 zinc finger domain-containing protein [Methylococcales bacterium]